MMANELVSKESEFLDVALQLRMYDTLYFQNIETIMKKLQIKQNRKTFSSPVNF